MYKVYVIENQVTERQYYGVSQEFEKRKNSHLNMLRAGTHNNFNLQKDWNMYGESNFEFKILHSFEDRDKAEEKEIELINKDKDPYNIVKDKSVGGDIFTYNPRKEEIRKSRIKQMTGKGNHQYGKPKTKKMIEAVKKANSKPVEIDGVQYPSAKEASRKLRVNHSTVLYRINTDSERFSSWKYI